MSNEFIENETEDGYTIRTDKLKDGQTIQCKEDSDMYVKKDGDSLILIKKSYSSNCFAK